MNIPLTTAVLATAIAGMVYGLEPSDEFYPQLLSLIEGCPEQDDFTYSLDCEGTKCDIGWGMGWTLSECGKGASVGDVSR